MYFTGQEELLLTEPEVRNEKKKLSLIISNKNQQLSKNKKK